MNTKLTEAKIRNLKPSAVRQEIADRFLPGFYCIVQPSGAISFAVRLRRPGGRTAKMTLGSYPVLTLAKARELGRGALIAAKGGDDPIEKRESKRAAEEAAAEKATQNTLRAVAERYLDREGPKIRTARKRSAIFQRLVYPELGNRQISEIRRGEIVALLDRIEDNSGAPTAQNVLAALSRLFNWYASRDDEFRSPIVRGMARINKKERARDHVLTDDELRAVWAASEKRTPFAALIRFLLLTAARRLEGACMGWEELNSAGDWLLPAARNKVRLDLLRPLSKAAQDILVSLPRLNPYVFTYGGGPISGFSDLKNSFDKECKVADWTLHDLRRTARSLMSRAGVHPDIAERCLGHVISGVRSVYDRYRYRDEMLHAYEALAAQIERIVSPQENVISLRR